MPFGLKNSPATFQRLVNTVLADVPNCTAYFDDLFVHSCDWCRHVESLQAVFTKLKEANLTLNLAKFELAQTTVDSWGMRVGQGIV